MNRAALPILTFALLAGCATAAAPDGRAALVGQPLAAAVEAIGYLPDERQAQADARTYVWQLGTRRKFNQSATAGTEGMQLFRRCTVAVVTGPDDVIREIDMTETRGGCADINRKLRLAAS
ncbi:MAG: hypothetical protein ACK40O_09490 [Allosphingosinicella sp.]